MGTVEIVVAFVVREDGRILVQHREDDPALEGNAAGLTWELPGGKLSPGESHAAALAREVREETGLAVEVGELVCALCHTYVDRRVALHAYICRLLDACPAGEGRWLTPDEYLTLSIPAANPPLVAALQGVVRTRTMPR